MKVKTYMYACKVLYPRQGEQKSRVYHFDWELDQADMDKGGYVFIGTHEHELIMPDIDWPSVELEIKERELMRKEEELRIEREKLSAA